MYIQYIRAAVGICVEINVYSVPPYFSYIILSVQVSYISVHFNVKIVTSWHRLAPPLSNTFSSKRLWQALFVSLTKEHKHSGIAILLLHTYKKRMAHGREWYNYAPTTD